MLSGFQILRSHDKIKDRVIGLCLLNNQLYFSPLEDAAFCFKNEQSFAWLRFTNFNIRKTDIRTYRNCAGSWCFFEKNYSQNESGGIIIWPDLVQKYFGNFFLIKIKKLHKCCFTANFRINEAILV
jgi:hypothetical protein